MIPVQQVVNGVAAYMAKAIEQNYDGNTYQRLLAGMAIGIAQRRAVELMQKLMENKAAQAVNLVNNDGKVDVELLRDVAGEQMAQMGKLQIDVPLLGRLTFAPADVEKIYETIMEG